MSRVDIKNVTMAYGGFTAVDSISLTVEQGTFLTLLGPSGCGKTTTLRIVAGFITPSLGEVLIGGKPVTKLPPNKRNTGMVFQNFALFPHMTVAENVGFGLKMRGTDGTTTRKRVGEALELVQLANYADRMPRQMSGGQQQRVALARAVAIQPEVLLLDEPLSALDLKLRNELQIQIRQVQQALKLTTIYVTHDQGEALRMSDCIAVMNGGKVVQQDTPQEIYGRPRDSFVARFIGEANLLDAVVTEVDVERKRCSVALETNRSISFTATLKPGDENLRPGQPVGLGFRPEAMVIGAERDNRMAGRITRVLYSGATWNVSVETETGSRVELCLPYHLRLPAEGENATFSWTADDCFIVRRASTGAAATSVAA